MTSAREPAPETAGRAALASRALLIIVVGFAITAPAMFYGIFGAHDLVAYHLKWARLFGEQLWRGELYPRWLVEMNGGFGSPTFFTYAPVAYYATALLQPISTADSVGWYQLAVSSAVAVGASGLTFYLWERDIVSARAAVMGAVIYMILPYHVAIDLYTRFAFGELWAFVWIPLILFFARRTIGEARMPMIGFAASLAMLFMTHIITFVMFAPVAMSYGPFVAGREARGRTLVRTMVGMVLAVALAAIYWIPAIGTQRYVSLSAPPPESYSYVNNFLFWGPPISHSPMFWHALEVVTALTGAVAVCVFLATLAAPGTVFKRESQYLVAAGLLSALMTCPLSRPIWAVLPPLQRIEFPWRFNVVLVTATAALVSMAMNSVRDLASLRKSAALKAGGVAFGVLSLAGCVIMATQLQRISDADAKELDVSVDGPAFRPTSTPVEVFNEKAIRELRQRVGRVRVESGQGQVSIDRWAPRSIVLRTDARTELGLTLGQFYYPGWAATLGGEGGALPVGPSETDGLVRVKVPAGAHEVVVELQPGVEERAGQVTSAVAVVAVLLLFAWFRRLDRQRSGRADSLSAGSL